MQVYFISYFNAMLICFSHFVDCSCLYVLSCFDVVDLGLFLNLWCLAQTLLAIHRIKKSYQDLIMAVHTTNTHAPNVKCWEKPDVELAGWQVGSCGCSRVIRGLTSQRGDEQDLIPKGASAWRRIQRWSVTQLHLLDQCLKLTCRLIGKGDW